MTPRPRILRLLTSRRLLGLGVALFCVFLVLWVVPSRDYIFLPDHAHPVGPLVTVKGGHEPANGGGIYFVDVLVRKATLLEELFGGLHHGSDLYPASAIVEPGTTSSQQTTINAAEMLDSQQVAAAVALRSTGRKVETVDSGVLVTAVAPGYPAAGKLEPTDVIVKVGATAVTTPTALTKLMQAKPIGSTVTFTVRRGKATKQIALTTVASTSGPKRGLIGIALTQSLKVKLPVPVSIDANGVGGPSAGLAFALDVLQQLGKNVDHGLKVAATGTISLNGQVGEIGGIKQKTYGARATGVDVFLVPAGENAQDARKVAGNLPVIPVKTFSQALHALATFAKSR